MLQLVAQQTLGVIGVTDLAVKPSGSIADYAAPTQVTAVILRDHDQLVDRDVGLDNLLSHSIPSSPLWETARWMVTSRRVALRRSARPYRLDPGAGRAPRG